MTVQRAHWSFTPGTRASVWESMVVTWGRLSASGRATMLVYLQELPDARKLMTVAGLQVPGLLMGRGPARMMSPNADWAPVLPIARTQPGITPILPTARLSRFITALPECGWWKMKSVNRCRYPQPLWMIFLSLFRIKRLDNLVRQNITNRKRRLCWRYATG